MLSTHRGKEAACAVSPVSRVKTQLSYIGHIIVIQKITIKTRQEQLLTDAERYSIQFDSTHNSQARGSSYCLITKIC